MYHPKVVQRVQSRSDCAAYSLVAMPFLFPSTTRSYWVIPDCTHHLLLEVQKQVDLLYLLRLQDDENSFPCELSSPYPCGFSLREKDWRSYLSHA
ncbi:hypothetical protein Tco_0661416 [Tanacetum coccineum]